METDKKFGSRFGVGPVAAQVEMIGMGYREVQYLAQKRNNRGVLRNVNALHPDRIFVPNV